MEGKDIRREQFLFKLVESVFGEPSLMVIFRGNGDVVRGEVTSALKETGWNWKVADSVVVNRYREHEFSFSVADMEWKLLVTMNEPMIEEPVKVAYVRIALIKVEPDYRVFPVTFWPDKAHRSEISLGSLVLSIVRGLTYIACDVDKFGEYRDLVRLSDDCDIVTYHNGMWLTRADIIMKRKGVPYDFVVTYHFNFHEPSLLAIPKVGVRYSVVARGKEAFDVLSEAIMDEYEFAGRGGER